MSTLTVTFAFAADAQGFVAGAGANSTLAWDGTTGNPSGSLSSTISGRSKSNANSWSLATSWAALGVPANCTISAISAASMQSRCTAYTTGAASTSGSATLTDGATIVALSSARAFSATDAAFVTTTGVGATGLSLDSGDSVTVTINNTLATGASNTASVVLKQDQLAFTITYSLNPVSGSLDATESGSDTSSIAGTVDVSGTLTSTESGSDAAAITGTVVVSGSLAAGETGSDAFAASGTVGTVASGTLAATETGTDTFAGTGGAAVAGTLAATEVGADTASAVGDVSSGVFGTMSAVESGATTFNAEGIVSALAVQVGGPALGPYRENLRRKRTLTEVLSDLIETPAREIAKAARDKTEDIAIEALIADRIDELKAQIDAEIKRHRSHAREDRLARIAAVAMRRTVERIIRDEEDAALLLL